MSFVKRRIDVSISLGEGQFGEQQGKEVALSGYRMSAAIVAYTAAVQGQMQLQIWGLPIDLVSRLTTIGPIMTQRRNNIIRLSAGDIDKALTLVYTGTITAAWGDYNQAPEVVFNVIAQGSAFDAVKPVAAVSYQGSTSVASIMGNLAQQMGVTLENNGVDVHLSNPYFSGTALDQVNACAKAAKISYAIERGILSIWPLYGGRAKDPIVISPETGLVGYPGFSSNGVVLNTLFNPALSVGAPVTVQSDIAVANGTWNTYAYAHMLESEMPNGRWFSQVQTWNPGNGQ